MKQENTLNELLYNYVYSVEDELSPSSELINKLPLLCDNNLACMLEDNYSCIYSSYPSLYKIASKYAITKDKSLKKFKRLLDTYEFGGSNNSSANEPEELLDIARSELLPGKYFIKLKNKNYMVIIIGSEASNDNGFSYITKVYFIGKQWRKYRDKFMSKINYYKDLIDKREISYIQDYSNHNNIETVFKSFDKLVIKNKADIINYIDNWYNNIPNYHNFDMIPKLSILLYGEPGTGKSTFAKAVAKYLNIDTVKILNQESFLNDNESKANRFNKPTVYLIDDIDCICASRDNENKNDNKNSQILSNLLAFLDNPPAFNIKTNDGLQHLASIVIATTNYYDKLDKAVKRYGRFDKKIEMKQFDIYQAEEMCELYGLKLDDLSYKYKELKDALKVKPFSISPSYLQSICLENIDKSLKGDE